MRRHIIKIQRRYFFLINNTKSIIKLLTMDFMDSLSADREKFYLFFAISCRFFPNRNYRILPFPGFISFFPGPIFPMSFSWHAASLPAMGQASSIWVHSPAGFPAFRQVATLP